MSFEEIRKKFQAIPLDDRADYMRKLTKAELKYLFNNPKIFLFDKQIPPETNWRYHLYRGARGTGKTFASTSWLYEKVIKGAREVAIVGPAYGDLVKEILPVFEGHFPPDKRPKFNSKENLYHTYNDCTVKVYSSDVEIRGLNAEFGIAEEICKWCDCQPDKIQERFDLFDLGVRSRRAEPCPQIFIASTPKPFKFFIDFEKSFESGNPHYSMIKAKTDENIYLPDSVKEAYHNKFDGTRLGRQELYGELLLDNPDALFTFELLEKCHIGKYYFDQKIAEEKLRIVKTVVAVDPAVSTNINSDETGIIVAALCNDNKVYILKDSSGKWTPDQWASRAVTLYKQYNAAHIVLEANQGGNLLEQAIKTVDRYVRVKLIRASVGKQVRFEPVVMAYERGEVMHVGDMIKLEEQMISYNPYVSHQSSPDRLDAAAYCVYYLLLQQPAPMSRSTKNFTSW